MQPGISSSSLTTSNGISGDVNDKVNVVIPMTCCKIFVFTVNTFWEAVRANGRLA